MTSAAPHILYLAHDLADAAVARRAAMLRAGGARVTLAGFARSGGAGEGVVLGRTHEGRMAQRAAAVARARVTVRARLEGAGPFDAVVARNLEMLALAFAAAGPDVPVAYECLDIHRLVLRRDLLGAALRTLERRLANRAALVLTSSPGFVREHWRPSGIRASVDLVENRVFPAPAAPAPTAPVPTAPAPRGERAGPIRIGWFGALRCRRSLDALVRFTRAAQGRFEVVLRGRPAPGVLDHLADVATREPHLRFEGPYRAPDDLPRIYDEVDLAWAVDFYEAGANSAWLLPNRLYESGLFGVPAIAMADVETGRFLAERNIGVRLPSLDHDALMRDLGRLDRPAVEAMSAAVRALPRRLWAADEGDCRALVRRIVAARPAPMRVNAPLEVEARP